MVQHVHAIYENGVLRPLEPLALDEHERVWVSVASGLPDAAQNVIAQRNAIDQLDAELDKLPDNSPDDGYTAADHDELLYGGGPA